MTGFSDPAWWPKRPPRPPAHVSLPKILLGSLVPLGLVTAVVVLVVTQRQHGPTTVRSVAAFQSCLDSHLGRRGGASTAGGRTGASAQALHDCEPLLPEGVAVGSLAPSSAAANAAEAQFQSCLRNAMAGLPRRGLGFGRFGGRPSSAVRAAIGVCQTLASSSSASNGSASNGSASNGSASNGSASSGPGSNDSGSSSGSGAAGSAPKI
jgi:hypothetical protein